jgi:hypothetical protein
MPIFNKAKAKAAQHDAECIALKKSHDIFSADAE